MIVASSWERAVVVGSQIGNLSAPEGRSERGLIPVVEDGWWARKAGNEGVWAEAAGGARQRKAGAEWAGIADKLPVRHPTRGRQKLSEPGKIARSTIGTWVRNRQLGAPRKSAYLGDGQAGPSVSWAEPTWAGGGSKKIPAAIVLLYPL